MIRLLLAVALATVTITGCKKEIVCPKGEFACDGRCVALERDSAHCGACGRACGTLEACDGGACACAPDTASCGGACADLRIDPRNCGACGTVCTGATPVCDGAGAGCVAAGACGGGRTACGSSCADLRTSPSHCGACGQACAPGQACIAGSCGAAVYAACYYTGEVKPLTRSLRYGGPTLSLAGARPSRIALSGRTLLAAAGQPQASLSFAPVSGAAVTRVELPGFDLEGIAVTQDVAVVTNAAVGTLDLVLLDGSVLDEIPMPEQQSFPNPLGVAVSGSSAYVALNGLQQVVRVDLSNLGACRAPDPGATACVRGACTPGRRCIGGACRLPCGDVASVVDLGAVAGATDGAALPFPGGVAAVGGKIFVTLANLEFSHVACDGFEWDGYARPAGPGRLAEIDPDAADTVAIVGLGEGCKSPSALAVHGSELWVSCGAYCFPDVAPGAVVRVDLSGGAPAVGTPIPLGATIAGPLALCGADGYVTDQRKTGAVVRFDPSAAVTSSPVAVCGGDPNGNAWASDILCVQ
jgi:hypothetical protein